jgi:hypothetical protein
MATEKYGKIILEKQLAATLATDKHRFSQTINSQQPRHQIGMCSISIKYPEITGKKNGFSEIP